MRVLLTGHHGFIGSAIAPMLVAAGHDVVGLDTFFYEGCDLIAERVEIAAIKADIRDVTEEQLDGFDAVVHLAALSNDPIGDLDPALTHAINGAATLRLGESARARGIERFVFASSCSMYGAANTSEPVTEDAPLAPLTAYAASKIWAERELLALADDGFAPVSLRNATAYGVSPRLRADVVLNNLVGWAVTTGVVRLLSDGTAWRPLVSVEDIGQAVLLALSAPISTIHGQAFNVGFDDENYRVREIAEVVRAAVPGSTVEIASGGADNRSYRVDFSRMREAFPSFVPLSTVADGARHVAASLRDASVTIDVLESDRYTRVRRLSSLLESGRLDASLRWAGARV
jgi:nucleoside-diphosphate-sugar epimerase